MAGITGGSTGITGSAGGGITGSGGGLSQEQSLALAYAAAQKKHGSLLNDILHGSGSALGTTLNYLGRPSQAVAGAYFEGTKAGDNYNLKTLKAAGSGFLAGLENKEHKTFSDTIRLKYPKFAAHHKVATAVAGLSADVLTDPTLPLVIGSNLIPGVGEGADAALAARLSAEIGRGKDAVDNYNKATEAYKALEKVGTGFDARKALAKLEAQKAFADITDTPLGDKFTLTLNIAQDTAKREAETQGRRVFQAKYSIPFSGGKSIPLTPTLLAGRRIAPLTPKLARTAAGEGVLSSIPGITKAAYITGKVFKHGDGEEEFAKPALTAAHGSEALANKYVQRGRDTVFAPYKNLTGDQLQKSLDWGETHTGLVSGRTRTLNEPMLQAAVDHGELSAPEAGFLKAWHDHMNYLDSQNKEFGLKYEDEVGDKVYVPHQFQRDGGIVTLGALKGKFGPGLKRENDLSIKQIVDSNAGHELNLETDPHAIMFHYSTQVAKHQAQNALLDYARTAAGVAGRIPDEAKNLRIVAHVGVLEQKMEDVPLLANVRGRRIAMGRQVQEWAKKKTVEAFRQAHEKMLPHELNVMHHVGEFYNGSGIKNIPSFSNARKLGSAALREQIAHIPVEDRNQLVKIHGLMAEHRRLSTQLAKFAGKRGGPATAQRKLADQVASLHKRITGDTISGASFAPTRRGDSWYGNLKANLEGHEQNLKSLYKEVKDKYPTTPQVNNLAAAKRAQEARDKIATQLASRVDRINEQAKLRRAKLEAQFEKDFDRHSATFDRLAAKRDHQISRLGKQFKNNPDIPEGFIKLEHKINGDNYYFPPEMHAAMTRMEAIYSSDTTLQEFENVSRKLLSSWKLSVTSINPGYRIRNTVSDLWNMYIAGVPIPRMAQYGAKAASLQTHIKSAGEKLANGKLWADLTKSERSAIKLHDEMQNHGILSGLFQGDVQRGATFLHQGNKWRDLAGNIHGPVAAGKWYLQFAQDINRNTENWGRITHYLYRRQYQHLNATDSADWVKKAHFDYTELSSFEQQKFKKWLPFYTWTRKDIPFQLSQLFSRPGKYDTYAKVARTSNELATGQPYGEDTQPNTLPSFYRDNFAFRVPGFGQEAYFVPNTGVQDLAKVTHPKQLASLLNPALTVPYELATGNSTFTGQPIQGTHPRNPISGWSASLLSHIPGTNVGTTSRNVRGEKVTGVGASPWVGFLAGQTPLTNFLVNQTSSIKEQQRGGGALAALNYAGGTSVYNRDLETEQVSAQLQFQDKMKLYLRGLRDIGIIPESAKGGTSAYNQRLQAILNG